MRTGCPADDDLDRDEQVVFISGELELRDALAPEGGNVLVHFAFEGDRRRDGRAAGDRVEGERGSVVAGKAIGFGELLQEQGPLGARLGPSEVLAFAVGEHVAVKPPGLDHLVHDVGEKDFHLVICKHMLRANRLAVGESL